jgi:hypothetical protein
VSIGTKPILAQPSALNTRKDGANQYFESFQRLGSLTRCPWHVNDKNNLFFVQWGEFPPSILS